jgi:hypothetical protein
MPFELSVRLTHSKAEADIRTSPPEEVEECHATRQTPGPDEPAAAAENGVDQLSGARDPRSVSVASPSPRLDDRLESREVEPNKQWDDGRDQEGTRTKESLARVTRTLRR